MGGFHIPLITREAKLYGCANIQQQHAPAPAPARRAGCHTSRRSMFDLAVQQSAESSRPRAGGCEFHGEFPIPPASQFPQSAAQRVAGYLSQLYFLNHKQKKAKTDFSRQRTSDFMTDFGDTDDTGAKSARAVAPHPSSLIRSYHHHRIPKGTPQRRR